MKRRNKERERGRERKRDGLRRHRTFRFFVIMRVVMMCIIPNTGSDYFLGTD